MSGELVSGEVSEAYDNVFSKSKSESDINMAVLIYKSLLFNYYLNIGRNKNVLSNSQILNDILLSEWTKISEEYASERIESAFAKKGINFT